MKVDKFSGEFEFLSNFYLSEVEMGGLKYPTVEHAFQAAKTLSPSERKQVQAASTPGKAKALGKKVSLMEKWDEKKVKVMHDLLVKKFSIPSLRDRLLNTAGLDLEEGNKWNDTFWGVCNGKGQNNLGKLLMLVREQLLAESA